MEEAKMNRENELDSAQKHCLEMEQKLALANKVPMVYIHFKAKC